MVSVLLATCTDWPDGEPAGDLLLTAFARRGVSASWAAWDDPSVDWGRSFVAVRSTWDYETRCEEFLGWARSVPDILHGASVFSWNTHKAYLTELAATGVPVVPTLLSSDAALGEAVATVLGSAEACVVKPAIGVAGRAVAVLRAGDPMPAEVEGTWVVQPLVESVRTEGETSVFVIGGVATGQVRKRPGAGEIRVHEHRGGTADVVPLDAESVDLAIRAVEASSDCVERHLTYARVDMLRLASGELVVSEVEATEPGLYLDILPENADHYAEAVLRHL